ncbi:hypothetical protein J6590_007251, partial [Homalodisca vitripennis]
TVSWIKKLTIEEAREQCKLWGIKPKDKLDAMRVQLSEFVARSSEGVVSDLEESADEPRVPVTDDLVDNPSLKQDEVGTCTVLPPVVPVDLGGLVKSLHTMTLNAIEATAKTVAQEIATQNRPYNRDDVSFPNILRDMLREVPITSDKTILLNAVARTEGRLRDVWMGLVSADSTWPNALQTIRTFYRGSSTNFDRDAAKRTPYSTFYPNHSFGGNQRQGSGPYNNSRPYQNFHSQPNNSRQGQVRANGYDNAFNQRLNPQGNSLKGPAFPKKTRPINPLAPALPKVKPLEIPIAFSNIKSSAVIDTGSTRSIVAKSVFDTLSKLKGVVKKVEETSLTATAANGSDVSFQFLAHIHFKLACFSWTFPFLVTKNLPVPVLIGLDFIQASEMSINAAQRQVSFPFDTSLVIAENQEDEQAEDVSLGPIFGERLDNSQVQTFKNILRCFPETVTKQLVRQAVQVPSVSLCSPENGFNS